MKKKILCVDDDANTLLAYQRSLRKRFTIDTAPGGAEALERLAADDAYAVIVSDKNMPNMDGIEFLAKARELVPDTVRMMLTGYADLETAMEALNEGRIFRFLTKPCSPQALATALDAAVEQYRLIHAEKDLLERTLTGSVELLVDLLAMMDVKVFDQAVALRHLVRALSKALHIQDPWELEIAAMLLRIGHVTLPPEVLLKRRKPQSLSELERAVLDKVPQFGHDLVKNIPRLEQVAQTILYQSKNYDGTGIPNDRVAAESIPLGARVLRILRDFQQLKSKGHPAHVALDKMKQRQGSYDPKILESLQSCFGEPPALGRPDRIAPTETTPICALERLRDLKPGHILANDLKTESGEMLLGAGHEITEPILTRIRNYDELKKIRMPVIVQNTPQSDLQLRVWRPVR